MKLLLSALFASVIAAPIAFAEGCEKGKCDKEKKESTVMKADCDCGDCDGKKCEDCDKCKKKEEKKEGSLACDKDKKDDNKKGEGALADCGKCKKEGEEKKEGTLV